MTTFPVMLADVLSHGEELSFWGLKPTSITCVDIVRSIEKTESKIIFIVEDESG